MKKVINNYFPQLKKVSCIAHKLQNILQDDKRKFVHKAGKLIIETSGVCNLLCKMCPYEGKEKEKKIIMDTGTFEQIVAQAERMGINKVQLVPSLGEVFMDKHFFKKLDVLEKSKIPQYSIVSNFIPLSEKDILDLSTNYPKLNKIKISAYGADESSFLNLTKRPSRVYHRFVKNLNSLNYLIDKQPDLGGKFWVDWWPSVEINENMDSELIRALHHLKPKIKRLKIMQWAQNRGGLITDKDVEGLALNVKRKSKDNGPCALLLYGKAILANGDISACTCGDKTNALPLGYVDNGALKLTSGENLTSFTNNDFLKKILSEQENNIFTGICKSCSSYESVLDKFTDSEYKWIKSRLGL